MLYGSCINPVQILHRICSDPASTLHRLYINSYKLCLDPNRSFKNFASENLPRSRAALPTDFRRRFPEASDMQIDSAQRIISVQIRISSQTSAMHQALNYIASRKQKLPCHCLCLNADACRNQKKTEDERMQSGISEN